MIAIITSVLSILAIVLEIIVQNRQTPQEKRYDEIQQGRNDIADADVDAINARIDRLLSQQDNDTAGQRGEEVTAGRISAVCGVADTGRSTSKDP